MFGELASAETATTAIIKNIRTSVGNNGFIVELLVKLLIDMEKESTV